MVQWLRAHMLLQRTSFHFSASTLGFSQTLATPPPRGIWCLWPLQAPELVNKYFKHWRSCCVPTVIFLNKKSRRQSALWWIQRRFWRKKFNQSCERNSTIATIKHWWKKVERTQKTERRINIVQMSTLPNHRCNVNAILIKMLMTLFTELEENHATYL